jgi:hypothetical protein
VREIEHETAWRKDARMSNALDAHDDNVAIERLRKCAKSALLRRVKCKSRKKARLRLAADTMRI